MKRLYTQKKYKRYNSKRAKRSLKRKLAFRDYIKKKNRSEDGVGLNQRHYERNFKTKYRDYKKIKAPEILSFINNAVPFIKFIKELEIQFENNHKVFVELTNVKKITYDAIVVLLSIMVKFRARSIDFDGNFPDDAAVRSVIQRSGFFKYLYKKFKDEEQYQLGKGSSIYTHARKKVDPVLGHKLIEQASQTIWGEKRRCQGVQRALLELMQNTNNHASLGREGEKHWWISVNHLEEEKKVGFSFVDFGVGIFTSLSNKNEGSKFFGWAEKMRDRFQYGSDAELLKLILNGELHRTVTGRDYRGKGLPGINDVLKRNQIGNLHIITNDVYSNIDQNKFEMLPISFSGTFIYWELNDNNVSCHGIN